jgi:predicted permease
LSLLLSIFVSDLLPVFCVAAVGFLLARRFDANVVTLSRVSFYALSPCLVFTTLVRSRIGGDQFGRMALFCLLVTIAIGLIARVAAVPLRLDRRMTSAFLLVVMFSNGGNYGMPVVLFAFGAEALSHAAVYFVTGAVLLYTLGVFLAAAGRRSIRHAALGVLRVPAVYGVLAAGLVLGTEMTVPTPIMRPVQLLNDAALPIMMLVLGMQLERAMMPPRFAPVVVAVTLSLLVTPMVAFGVASGLHLTGPAWPAAMIQASMPAAVVTTILALEYDIAPAFVTSVVFASTLLSPLTLTVLIACLKQA